MSRPLPAAAFLLALYWGGLSGETAQAAMVTTEVEAYEASSGAGAAPVDLPAEEPAPPMVYDGVGETAGSAGAGPVVSAGAALPAAPALVTGPTLTVSASLPNRCLRPLLYPGGVFRPPRCA